MTDAPALPEKAGIFDEAPCGQVLAKADGGIVAVNSRFAAWSGRSVDDLGGLTIKSLLTPASRILYETHYFPLLQAQGFASEVMLELLRPDGERFSVLFCATRRIDGGTLISVFDARELRRHERELVAARLKAEAAVDELRATLLSIADGVVVTGEDGRVRSMNLKAQEILGVEPSTALGQPLAALGSFRRAGRTRQLLLGRRAQDRWPSPNIDLELIRPDSAVRQISGTVASIGGPGGGRVFVCRDVTEERLRVHQLAHDASHDHLTGLLNRREFERRLNNSMQSANSERTSDLVCYIDLDQFKIINDTAGHVAGDQLLIEVGRVLRCAIRETDTLARLGGDEFGIILHGCSLEAGARIADEARLRLAALRFVWAGQHFSVTASIGMSACDMDNPNPAAALAIADMACNAAKEGGRNRVRSFEADDPAMLARRDDMGWVTKIRRALEENMLSLTFQPIARLVAKPGSRPHGEILLRLKDDDGQLVAPGAFIAAAERYQQMQPIDSWVVRRSLAWLSRTPDIGASINLSGQSVGDPSFLKFVLRELHDSGIVPGRICFEITETAAMADMDAALRFMNALRALGVRFALDDFGVGLSSFRYLQQLPVDFVKIDGSFTRTLLHDRVNRAIVESISSIAGLCGLETVAEWVESAAVQDALGVFGIDYVQGWHVGKPIPIESVAAGLQPCVG